MAESILLQLSSWVQNSVAFSATNEATGLPLWSKIGLVDVEIKSTSKNARLPLSNVGENDDGTYTELKQEDILAAKIIQPDSINVTAFVGDLSTLESIVASFADLTQSISINSKSIQSSDMVITGINFDQTPEMLSATKVNIVFEQCVPPQAASFNPEQDGDASVSGFRIQSLSQSSTTLSGLFGRVAQTIIAPAAPVIDALLGNQGEPFVLDESRLG